MKDIKKQIENLLIKFEDCSQALDELLILFSTIGSSSVDTLDDENSEIYKIGLEIAEMSDEEFETNCKAFENIAGFKNKK